MAKIGMIIMFLLQAQFLMSQSENLRLGFQMSPTITTLKSSDSGIETMGGNLGIVIGAIGEYYLTERFAVTTGLNLSFHQGGKLVHVIGGNFWPESELSDDLLNTGDKPLLDGTKLTYSLQSLEIPFSLKIRSNEIGYFRMFAEIPMLNFSFVTQARGDIEGDGVSVEKENIRRDISSANLWLGFGAGGEYALSETNSLVFGFYYNWSIVDVTNNTAYKAFINPNDTPGDPTDDFFRQEEDSKGTISRFTLKIGLLF